MMILFSNRANNKNHQELQKRDIADIKNFYLIFGSLKFLLLNGIDFIV